MLDPGGLNFNLYDKSINWEDYQVQTWINQTGNSYYIQLFSEWHLGITDKLKLKPGINYSQLLLNGNSAIEPRLGLQYFINSRQSIEYGFGMHSKAEPLSIYLAEATLPDGTIIQPNRNLSLTKSIQNVLGYNWSFAPNWRLKLETYYQFLYDVPVAADSSYESALNYDYGFTNEKFSSSGTGYNYGVELTIDRFFAKGYHMMFTSSLFNSKYKALDGILRNTKFNTNYIMNFLAGKEYSVGKAGNNTIGFNSRMIWRGGFRTIPIDIESSKAQGETVYIEGKAFENRAPDYFRLDF